MKNVIAKGNHVTMRSAEMECVVRVLYLEVLCFFTESAGIIRVSIGAGRGGGGDIGQIKLCK